MSELSVLQERINRARIRRDGVTDPLQLQMLLMEEVGSISTELKPLWSTHYDAFDRLRLADELADTFVILCGIADVFDIDLEQAVESKFFTQDTVKIKKLL